MGQAQGKVQAFNQYANENNKKGSLCMNKAKQAKMQETEQDKVELFNDYLNKNNFLVVQYDSHLAGVDGFVVTDMQRIIQENQINGDMSIILGIIKVETLAKEMIGKLYDYYCRSWLHTQLNS